MTITTMSRRSRFSFDAQFNRLPFVTIGWEAVPGASLEQRVLWFPHPLDNGSRIVRLPWWRRNRHAGR